MLRATGRSTQPSSPLSPSLSCSPSCLVSQVTHTATCIHDPPHSSCCLHCSLIGTRAPPKACQLTHSFLCLSGDFGHGILMFAFAAYLLVNEKKFLRQTLDELFGMAFGGRYCIILMATFSIYTGEGSSGA